MTSASSEQSSGICDRRFSGHRRAGADIRRGCAGAEAGRRFSINGPADPAAVDYAIASIRELLGRVADYGHLSRTPTPGTGVGGTDLSF